MFKQYFPSQALVPSHVTVIECTSSIVADSVFPGGTIKIVGRPMFLVTVTCIGEGLLKLLNTESVTTALA
ncbi:hypothetical protein [Bacillus sp. 165]|uniref:hypothetical protein n=1 Tax=Bacillus sp. 165 TaxID=1529117 RepID=UPI001ADC96D8|nr:hypothetical protein [Bacillus sp. 165]MBO9129850.1 hypothetical protein [Bacillus sp. 165]